MVVLHDAVLQHFFLGSLDAGAYVEEFVYNYGPWSRDLALELYRARASSGFDSRYFQYPMLRRIVERARATIVHNPAAAAIVRRHAPDARVIEIPHLFARPQIPTLAEALRFRQRLDIPACAFVFGIFGYLRESKRVLATLRAFEEAQPQCRNAVLLLAGDFVSSDLARAAAPWLSHDGIRRLPYLAGARFLAGRAGHRRLHQPALSGRRRDLRHRHPLYGDRQARDGHRERGNVRFSRGRLRPHRPRYCGNRGTKRSYYTVQFISSGGA